MLKSNSDDVELEDIFIKYPECSKELVLYNGNIQVNNKEDVILELNKINKNLKYVISSTIDSNRKIIKIYPTPIVDPA